MRHVENKRSMAETNSTILLKTLKANEGHWGHCEKYLISTLQNYQDHEKQRNPEKLSQTKRLKRYDD